MPKYKGFASICLAALLLTGSTGRSQQPHPIVSVLSTAEIKAALNEKEYAIWFWKSYFSFEDYDGDGRVDPFLVYGTWGDDGYENGRIKFIIYFNGKKFAMRHQSSTFDEVRSTEF
jgi:hypothetical protein